MNHIMSFHALACELKAATETLKDTSKESAQATISSLLDHVSHLQTLAENRATEQKQHQRAITDNIGKIIENKTSIGYQIAILNNGITEAKSAIHVGQIEENELNAAISKLKKDMNVAKVELAKCKDKMDRINDKSAISIILSIISLGLDRAFMGIDLLVQNVMGRIQKANDELTACGQKLSEVQNKLQENRQKLYSMQEQIKNAEIARQKCNEELNQAQKEEEATRQKLALCIRAADYYNKLTIALERAEEGALDLDDLVYELGAGEQTSGDTAIEWAASSMYNTLEQFDKLLADEGLIVA